MGHCFTRLFSRYFKNNKFETKKKKTGKIGNTIVKLSKITDNFYCLNRKGNQWSQSEKELLDNLIDYKIFYPIPSGFCREAIFGSYNPTTNKHDNYSDTVIFNYDTYNGKKRSLRGIASASLDTESNEKFMILNLIGNISTNNKPVSLSKKRNNIQTKSGRDIIEYLKQKARKLKLKYIKLHSMETVIGFYWKMGWRFKRHNQSSKYYSQKIKELNKINVIDDNDVARDKILTKYFDRFLPGYYSDKLLSQCNTWDPEHTDYDITTTLRRQRWELRYHGYPMYWYC